jgi:aldehyde dehydrogenase (NAD+)
VHESIKIKFIETLSKILNKFYVNVDKDMAKIINKNRFNKLISYLGQGQIVYGGNFDEEKLQIMPTLIEEPSLNNPVMQEEIFGPILPIIGYHSDEQLKKIIARNPDPLALYIFSNNKQFIDDTTKEISFGGGCINSSLIHLTNNRLPFGGVMSSGNGLYQGKYSFTTFSHQKSIVNMSTYLDIKLKYPPYNRLKTWLIRKLI